MKRWTCAGRWQSPSIAAAERCDTTTCLVFRAHAGGEPEPGGCTGGSRNLLHCPSNMGVDAVLLEGTILTSGSR